MQCSAVQCSAVQWNGSCSGVELCMQGSSANEHYSGAVQCSVVRGMLCSCAVQCSAVLCNNTVHAVVKWSSARYAMLCSSAVQWCSG